jgi:hypothetical protein
MRAASRSSSVSPGTLGALTNQYASTGTMVSATTREAPIAIATVSANGRKSSPVMPPTRAIGANTATVVMVDAVIAPPTSRTAPRIAGSFSSPYDRCRLMFSMTTIASSTTRPMEIVSAPRVRMFSV